MNQELSMLKFIFSIPSRHASFERIKILTRHLISPGMVSEILDKLGRIRRIRPELTAETISIAKQFAAPQIFDRLAEVHSVDFLDEKLEMSQLLLENSRSGRSRIISTEIEALLGNLASWWIRTKSRRYDVEKVLDSARSEFVALRRQLGFPTIPTRAVTGKTFDEIVRMINSSESRNGINPFETRYFQKYEAVAVRACSIIAEVSHALSGAGMMSSDDIVSKLDLMRTLVLERLSKTM
jgi:hypothetical protein